MSFGEARRLKNEEQSEKTKLEIEAATNRADRKRALEIACVTDLPNYTRLTVSMTSRHDTVRLEADGLIPLEVTVLNGGQFRGKLDTNSPQQLARPGVRYGQDVQGDEVFRLILDWIDGDL